MSTENPAVSASPDEALRTVSLLLKLADRVADESIQRILLEAGHQVADLALIADVDAAPDVSDAA